MTEVLHPPQEPLSLESVSIAYAQRDRILSPNMDLGVRMNKYFEKLGWCCETEDAYQQRLKKEAIKIFASEPRGGKSTVSDVWDRALESACRRVENPRIQDVRQSIMNGMSAREIYFSHFTLDELILLGW